MAWNDTMVPMLRLMIGDVDPTNYKYDDDRLEQQLLLAAQLIQGGELDFPNVYVINIPSIELSPDPTEQSPQDDAFVNLVTLKAACLLDTVEARIAAEQGIDISDVGSRIALSGRAGNKIKLLLGGGYCAAYQLAKKEYLMGSLCPGMAVMSPFRIFNGWDSSDSPLHEH
jgi:hypothetical protein